jgi:hypothetical protein
MALTPVQTARGTWQAQDGASEPGRTPAARPGANTLRQLQTAAQRTMLRLPSGLEMAAWLALGRQLHVVADSSAWWLGDWLVFGQNRFPDRYEQAIAESSLDYQTLRNYAWVARKIPPELRRAELSFQHHAEVAALPEDERARWLDRAKEGGWSRSELRRRLRTEDSGHRMAPAVLFTLNVPSARQERWQRAALRAELQLDEWIVRTLDNASAHGVALPPGEPAGTDVRRL